MARSLINNNRESKVHVSVLNITEKPIKLKYDDILGHVCPVTENNPDTCQTPESIQVPKD